MEFITRRLLDSENRPNMLLNSFRRKYVSLHQYSRLSSRNPRDFLKYFEISVPRHIIFAKFRGKKEIEQPNSTNEYVI